MNLIVKRFILYSSLLSTLFSLIFMYASFDYSLIGIVVLIPIIYGFLYYFFIPRSAYFGPGWIVINIIMYLRYVLFVPFYVLNSFKSSVVEFYENYYIFITFFIILLELISIFLCANYFISKFSKKNINPNFFSINNFYFLAITLSLSAVSIFLNPIVLLNFNFVFDTTKFADETFAFGEQEFVFGSGPALELIKYSIILLNLYIFEKFLIKFYQYNSFKFLFISIVPFLISTLFYIGISRSSILIPFLAYLFLVVKYYKKDSLRVLPMLGIYISILIISLTIFKQFRTASVNDGVDEFVDIEFFSNFLNDYTSSFPNVYSGFVNVEKVSSLQNNETILNDYISAIPILHRYADMSNRTAVLFNRPFSDKYKTSHRILPLNIQGIMHFGFPFFVLYPILLIFFILKFDNNFKLSNNVYYSFVFAFISVGIGFSLGHTFTFHVLGRILRVLIPMLIFMSIIKIFSRIK